MSEYSLRQDIIDELEFEPSVNAAHIGVAVHDDVVTLTGHVSTYAEKLKIEEIVWQVRGVKAIAEEIEVRIPDAARTSDEEIAKRAANQLQWGTVIPAGAVHVKVQDGWVSLSGSVEWQYQKRAAYDTVRGLSGVRGISNLIDVHPLVSASDVKRRIEDALKRNAEMEAHNINVNVIDGKVVLEGQVKTWSQRAIAERAAWAVPGVKTVDDRLTI